MAERRQGSTVGDHAVVRLVVDYVHCPQCDLTVPAFIGPEPLAIVRDGSMTRCGFCKWVFAPGPRMPLQVRHRCGDCGTTMRGPEGAAVLVCRTCATWYHNPELDPATRGRVERILQDQHRYAALVDEFLVAAERMIPPSRSTGAARTDVAAERMIPPTCSTGAARTDVAAGASRPPHSSPPPFPVAWARPPAHAGAPTAPAAPPARPTPSAPATPGDAPGAPLGHRAVGTAGAGNVRTLHPRRPSGGAGRSAGLPMTDAFPAALSRAVREALPPRQRRVLELRYGLDGGPGRTFGNIAAVIGRSPSRARALLAQALGTIAALARQADASGSREYLSCSITVHLAAHAVGDPLHPQAPDRIRDFVDAVLPRATPAAATDLLLRLAGLRDKLASTGQDRALRRAVTTARPG